MNTYVLKEVDSTAIITVENPFVGVKCNIDLSDREDLVKAAREIYDIISDSCKGIKSEGSNHNFVTYFKGDISEPLSRLKKGVFKSNCDCKIYIQEDSDIIGITFSDNMYSESQERRIDNWINDKIVTDLHEAISDITIFRTDM